MGPSVAGPQASRTVDSWDFAASWGAAASEEEEGDCLVDCLADYRKLDGIAPLIIAFTSHSELLVRNGVHK